MNHKAINTALNIVIALTAVLLTYALYNKMGWDDILAISFTGVAAISILIFNRKVNQLTQ